MNIKNLDVHGEEFQTLLVDVLTKFTEEYDDMSEMTVIQKAGELLEAINN